MAPSILLLLILCRAAGRRGSPFSSRLREHRFCRCSKLCMSPRSPRCCVLPLAIVGAPRARRRQLTAYRRLVLRRLARRHLRRADRDRRLSHRPLLARLYPPRPARRRARAGKAKTYYGLFSLFLATMLLDAISNNIVMMWVAVEGTTLGSAFLVGLYGRKSSLEAAWKYRHHLHGRRRLRPLRHGSRPTPTAPPCSAIRQARSCGPR